MPSKYVVIKALKSYQGDRFPFNAGELKRIRGGYDDPQFVPRIVERARLGGQINSGGATVLEERYVVLFDGPGPFPPEFQQSASVTH